MKEQLTLNGLDFSPEENLSRYLQSIKKFPILSSDEEYNLALQYQKTKDAAIAYKLITSHLRLVVKVVAKYRGYGLPIGEMISEGNIGLMYAIDKFAPEKGFRFSTYSLWWIKASVQKYILNSWSLVKLGTTAAQKKLFFNLRKIKNKLNLIDDRELSQHIKIKNRLNLIDDRELSQHILNDIARSLDVSVQDVTDMNMRLKSHDGSLNSVIDGDTDGTTEWMDFISDSKPNQEETLAHSEIIKYRKQMFNQALYVLNKREKDILFKRRLYEKTITLDDLSKTYNISKERVRQIELNSIKKITKAIELMQ